MERSPLIPFMPQGSCSTRNIIYESKREHKASCEIFREKLRASAGFFQKQPSAGERHALPEWPYVQWGEIGPLLEARERTRQRETAQPQWAAPFLKNDEMGTQERLRKKSE